MTFMRSARCKPAMFLRSNAAVGALLAGCCAWPALAQVDPAAARSDRTNPSASVLAQRQLAVDKMVRKNDDRSPQELAFALNQGQISEVIDDLFSVHPQEKGGGQVLIVIQVDGSVGECQASPTSAPITPGFLRDLCRVLMKVPFGKKAEDAWDVELPIGIHARR